MPETRQELVVVVCRSTPGHRVGGMETYLDGQLSDLDSMGFQVHLITAPGMSQDYAQTLVERGVTWSTLEGEPSQNYSAGWHAKVGGYLEAHKARTVIFHGLAGISYRPGTYQRVFTLTHGSALLSLFNSRLGDRKVRSALGRLRTLFFSGEFQGLRSHQLIALSEYDARLTALSTLQPRSRVMVIPPPVGFTSGSAARDKLIVYGGRVERSKGILDILAAWNQIDHGGYTLVVAGDGADLNVARETARSDVNVMGAVSRPELSALFASARWSVAGGTYKESFGLAAAESIAAGTPVIYRDSGALKGTVGPGGLRFRSRRDLPDVLRQAIGLPASGWSELHQSALNQATRFSATSHRNAWKELLS